MNNKVEICGINTAELPLMKEAEKFRRPVICLVDTLGAYCGAEAVAHRSQAAGA